MTIDIDKSPSAQRIVALLKAGPQSKRDLEAKAFTTYNNAARIVRELKADKIIHICGWRHSVRGPLMELFLWGNKPDVPKIKPNSNAEKCAKYRENLRLKHGSNYKHVHQAMKAKQPGLTIYQGGKAVYSCK